MVELALESKIRWYKGFDGLQEGQRYLVVAKGGSSPLYACFAKNKWFFLVGYSQKDDHLEEIYDDFDETIEVELWAEMPNITLKKDV